MKQRTLKNKFSFSGIGLHTGVEVTAQILPAGVNHGISFKRTDLVDSPQIMAHIENVTSTNRSTTIGVGDARVSTIEHTLSALAGHQIDNAIIEVSGPEMPILDGSAKLISEGIEKVGFKELDAERQYLIIREPIHYRDEATGSEITALPSENFEVTCMIDFDSSVLGQQYAVLNNMSDYTKEIASSRTFVFLHELEYLMDQNLIKGGDLDNAIVIVDRNLDESELQQLASKLGRDQIRIEEEGILNNVKLQYSNEPARHKLLDLIGDLSLIGRPIKGKIIATKPGHAINLKFSQKLKSKEFSGFNIIDRPDLVNLNQEPAYDANRVRETLPHRFPFLLIDKIIDVTEHNIIGVKNVSYNEHYFLGHFPNNPIMPGVLQVEAMAQTGGIFALHNKEEPHLWDTYFMKIENARFKRKVVPGDTLVFILELLAPIRRGICQMRGKAYVKNQLVSEAKLVAKILKRVDG